MNQSQSLDLARRPESMPRSERLPRGIELMKGQGAACSRIGRIGRGFSYELVFLSSFLVLMSYTIAAGTSGPSRKNSLLPSGATSTRLRLPSTTGTVWKGVHTAPEPSAGDDSNR